MILYRPVRHTLVALLSLAAAYCLVATPVLAAPAEKGRRPPPAAVPAPAAVTEATAAPTAPGTLVLVADADDLIAEIKPAGGEGKVVGLKIGENRVETPAGDATVAVSTKTGRKVGDYKVTIVGGEAQNLPIVSRGTLIVKLAKDASLAVDDMDIEWESDQFTVSVAPGLHSVIVQRPGFFGQKGQLEVTLGKTATLVPTLDEFDAGGKKTFAWVGIIGGGVLVIGALVVDATTRFDEFGGDTVRWTLLGAGAAAFVGGTVMLKNAMDEVAPINDATFSIRLARTPGGGLVALRTQF
ncbi:MAG: hypothetical protein EXR77_02790 [Myxococcales bacterium]|nr:hypothetical protein [Myxococcales bacterium]